MSHHVEGEPAAEPGDERGSTLRTPTDPAQRRTGVLIGLATAAAGLGVAELVAGLSRRFSSPVTQVGNRVIDAAPPWLKTFAIETFGTADKPVLIGGVLVVLLIIAGLLGTLARRHRFAAQAGIALFGGIGAAAALGGEGGPVAAVPSIVGGIAGVVVLGLLAARAWPESSRESHEDPAPIPSRPSRRIFLRTAGVVAAVGVAAAAGGRVLRQRFDAAVERAKVVLPRPRRPLPPVSAEEVSFDVAGLTPFVTPNNAFYRIDTALEVPQVALADWTLEIGGMVKRPLTFTYDDLLARDLVEADVTLTCVSNEVGGNLAGNARWLGVPLEELLEEAGVDPEADQVVGRSVDGYTCGFPVEAVGDGRTALVAVGMNGEPLPVAHGFPARLVVAGLYGYVSATKWLREIELTRFDRFDQYWVPRGWDAKAPVKTASRIDTPRSLSRMPAGVVAVAGVAWAQGRGITDVEVRVDDGPWRRCDLAGLPLRDGEPTNETWRQWMLPVELGPGRHTITCRATDGSGAIQTEQRSEPRPNGATGWHSVVVIVE